jgi:CubicO group peptidase (beta-lactamase class C family)
MKIRLSLLAISLCASMALAQTGATAPGFENVDRTVSQFLQSWNIKGGSVAITKDRKLIYSKGFGTAGANDAMPNTLYRVASVSKPVTSIAVMKLAEDKLLSLNDRVFGKGRLISDPYYLDVISDKRIYDITVNDLLEHTSGWDRNMPCDGYPHSDPAFFPLHVAAAEGESNPVGDSTLIKFSLRKGLHNAPGEKYSYSNVGYLILGKIIENVSGMKYEEYVQRNVLSPAGAFDFQLGSNMPGNRSERESEYFSPYKTYSSYGDGAVVPWQYGGFNIEAMNAHGGWVASAPDLARLMVAIDPKGDLPVLNRESVQAMKQSGTVNPGYGKGWFVNSSGTIWHTGSLDGTASFVCQTADGYTWAFLFNSRSDNSDAFWRAFDRLPWNCLKQLPAGTDLDLFQPVVATASVDDKQVVTEP